MSWHSKNVCVVVLGDIGRSPRMQYHSLSLARDGHKVDIIGYGETEPFLDIKREPLINYHYLLAYPNYRFIPRLLNYILKTIWQTFTLFYVLTIIRKPDIILVQNPPAVPTLVVCWLFKSLVRAKLIIDWHNYAFTIMALSVGRDNILVKITKKVEAYVGSKADGSFCVTNYMKSDLMNWNISAVTLYDRPPEKFKPISLDVKHKFLNNFAQKYKIVQSEDGGNLFTGEIDGSISLKRKRPGLLVSSTSWTEDEDFSILFSALEDYELYVENGNAKNLPKLICIITGKGPLKDYYCDKIALRNWKNVFVLTPWLEDEDYPLVLASADLGVCLHKSSSGMDLPMKVVDMFGCGLPVCAFDFPSLKELVKNEENGYTFQSSDELLSLIQAWFSDFPSNENQQALERKFKANLQKFQELRWSDNWQNIASPVFK